MRRALATTLALGAALGAFAGCSGPGGDDSTGEAVAMAVGAVADAVPAVADAVPAVAQAVPAAGATVRTDAALADQAREIIRPTCGSCHTTSSPKANPKALAVYDLDRADWGATMSRARLTKLEHRLEGVKSLTDADRAIVASYVEALRPRAEE